MRVLVQRVTSACVTVKGEEVGRIGRGLLLFVGFGKGDDAAKLPAAIARIAAMRVFGDAAGKLNLALAEIGGEALIVSQFTLYANCSRGRRPDFTPAAEPLLAKELYEQFTQGFRETGIPVRTGIFAADMSVELVNDGPVTFFLEF